MAMWSVRVITDSGVKTVKIDAPDEAAAERSARRKGSVIAIKRRFSVDLTPGMNHAERNTFMSRLSSMVGSKMGAADALRLISTSFSGRIKTAAAQMLQRIEDGMSLPEAIDADRKNFPIATAALVKAGTQGGETWRALRDAAEFEYQIRTIQKGSVKDVATAMMTFLIAAALMISTTEYFGPQVLENKMFANNDAINVGWAVVTGKILSGIMVVLLVIFFLFTWLGTVGRAMFPDIADKIILRIPYYKDLVLARNNYVVLYKLGLLIQSGVRLEECFALTAEGSPKGAIRSDVERALAAIRRGKNWANCLETLHVTDRAALSASTDFKDIANSLNMLSTQYKDTYMQRMRSFAPTLQMVSALFMTAAGGILFALTILPMLQLAASVQ